MEIINEATLLEVLRQLESTCPAFCGAVVATSDGLVLAAFGEYQGDTPAACATSLAVHLKDDLSHLNPTDKNGPNEALVFGQDRLWYLSRLSDGHLLLIESRQTVNVGAVRLAGRTITGQLNRGLGV